MISEIQPGNTARPELYEMLQNIENSKTPEDKDILAKQYLSKYSSFRDYLRCVFDQRIQFLLPEGRPPFDPAKEDKYPSTWHKQNSKLQYIVKGLKADNVHPIKRETIFIGILESVHPSDSEILISMISKKLPNSVSDATAKVLKEVLS